MKKIILWGDLVIDHNTIGGEKTVGPGGAAYFSAKIFENFGLNTLIIAPRGEDYDDSWIPGSVFPAKKQHGPTPVYENLFDTQGNRTQYAHNRENSFFIDPASILSAMLDTARAVIICPVNNNVALKAIRRLKEKLPQSTLLACMPQGFFRGYRDDDEVYPIEWHNAEEFMPFFDIICLSELDGTNLDERASNWSTLGPVVILTRAENGCNIYKEGARYDFPAFPVEKIVDPVGAGDVFAAAFLYNYLATKDFQQSAIFANAAGALSLHYHAHTMNIGIKEITQLVKAHEVQ